MSCGACAGGCGRCSRGRKGAEKRLALIGNPNSGKSTLFNALTGGHARTGNWHGVTVGVQSRPADLCGVRAEVFDLPGLYAMRAYTREEEVARRAAEGEYDLAVCVADALALPRSLSLLADVLRFGRPTVLVVTMTDALKKRGGRLDAPALSLRLGVPVLAVCARRRGDVARLCAFLRAALEAPPAPPGAKYGAQPAPPGTKNGSPSAFPAAAGSVPAEELLRGVWEAGRPRQSRVETWLYTPAAALPLFAACFLLVFFLAFGPGMPGVWLKEGTETLVSDLCGAGLARLLEGTGSPVGAALARAVFGGAGMVLSFLPQLAILYAALFLLEESGCMSALAFLTDGLFEKIGLTGRAVFSLLMGFGCTAAAILTTRGLENEKLQRRVICILPYLSCSAKLPVYLMLVSAFFGGRFLALVGLYLAGVLIACAAAALLKGRGEEEFVLEMARLQCPSWRSVGRSLLHELCRFAAKVATVVAAVLVAVWFLLSFSFSFEYVGAESGCGMLAVLCRGLKYLFYPMGIDRWEVALAALTGLIAKESVAGTLALFFGSDLTAAMSAPSAAAFLAFLLTCSPCVSAIAATAREAGIRRALAYAAFQTASAFLFSYIVYALLSRGAAAAVLLAALAPAAAACILFFGFRHEKKHRNKTAVPARLHRRTLRAGFVRLFAPSARGGDPRQRRAGPPERPARPGRRSGLVHDREGRGAPLLRRRVRGRKRARRRQVRGRQHRGPRRGAERTRRAGGAPAGPQHLRPARLRPDRRGRMRPARSLPRPSRAQRVRGALFSPVLRAGSGLHGVPEKGQPRRPREGLARARRGV